MVERIVGLYSKNRMKHIAALCGKYVAIFNDRQVCLQKVAGEESVIIKKVLWPIGLRKQ